MNRIKDDLKKLVQDTVREELIQESKIRHYTKRMQDKLLSTQQNSLVDKIENRVNSQLQSLKNEVASLRMARLNISTPVSSSPSPNQRYRRKEEQSQVAGGLIETEGSDVESLLTANSHEPDVESSIIIAKVSRGGRPKENNNW